MMTIRIDINHETISIIDVVNRGPVDSSGSTVREYEWAENYHRAADDGVARPVREVGAVQHDRSDGAARLAAIVLQQLSERRP